MLFALSPAFLQSGGFSSGGCTQAHPLGVVPEIRADCLQSVRVFYALCFISCLPPIGRLFFRWVRASAPTGCSPRDSGRLLAIGSDLLCSLLYLLPSSNRETFLPVGARKRTHWV